MNYGEEPNKTTLGKTFSVKYIKIPNLSFLPILGTQLFLQIGHGCFLSHPLKLIHNNYAILEPYRL
jgi:hypothetical protein